MSDKKSYKQAVSDHEIGRPADDSSAFFELSRRSLMIGAAGAAGIAGLPGLVTAREQVDVDVHTRQTYRSIVDAVVPRTPERDGVQEPGALDVELEKYLIWNLEHGTDQPHQRALTTGTSTNAGESLREALRVDLRAEDDGLENLVAALEAELGFSTEEDLGMSRSEVYGALAGLELTITGNGDSRLTVETVTEDGTIEETTEKRERLPLATLHATVLDLYALVFVLGGGNRGDVRPRRKFAGGGFFTFLAPIDRIQCLLYAIDSHDDLAGVVEEVLPEAILAKKLSSGVVSLTPFGYYSEWAGYGDTKTEPMDDRELERPAGEVQSHRQVGYPGPADGYAGFHGYPIDSFEENDWE